MNKRERIEAHVNKLKSIASAAIDDGKTELAYAAISACSLILYNYNQYYFDEELENDVSLLSKNIIVNATYSPSNGVLFYDGFGFDLRGWAISFVKALSLAGYPVIYVAPKKMSNSIPNIRRELGCNKVIFVDTSSYKNWSNDLNSVFYNECPRFAFFYTTPNDVVGATVFKAYDNKVKRIQVDLTDHAYWLGVCSNDLFFESRDIGARIAVHQRKINPENIMRLDCTPYINHVPCDQKLPFEITQHRYFFSGGSLYKTLGDKDLLFYKMVKAILELDKDIKYLYAGSGDSSEIQKLINEYSGRVFLIGERTDFFEIIRNCVFYLNTYPMFGGLMMRYSALAHKIPLTLRHDNDADGILIGQKELGIEFDSFTDVINEARKILSNDHYRTRLEEKLYHSVINEECFERNLRLIVEEGRTEFTYEDLQPVDTTQFRAEYYNRFDLWEDLDSIIGYKIHRKLWRYFPGIVMKKIICKFKR